MANNPNDGVTLLEVIAMILGSSLLTTIFSKVFDYVTHSKKTTQILLLSSMEQLCDKIIAQGYRTSMQTLRLSEIKDQYKKVGGDGYADAMYQEAMSKPLNSSLKGDGVSDI